MGFTSIVSATAAALALAAFGADAQVSTSGGFRTCRRIDFSEPAVAAGISEGSYSELGIRIVVRASPGPLSEGVPASGSYTGLASKPAAIFDTSRVTGRDVDLGAPNWQCNAVCPAGDFAHCSVCADPLADPKIAKLSLPAGHPGCGTDASPDFGNCPGVGCGGGFWLSDETSTNVRYTYPFRSAGGTVTPTQLTRKRCRLVLDPDGCPVPNPAMNCRSGGKVLIVQENAGEPDDDASGGTIQFIFEDEIELLGVSVLDLDDLASSQLPPGAIYGQASTDESVNDFSDPSHIFLLGGKGDNSLTQVDEIDMSGLHRVVIWLRGSGSVNDIEYCGGRTPEIEVTTSEECRYTWDITKTVNQEQWDLFAGEASEEVFTTTITRSEECESRGHRASGTVTVGSPSGRNHRIVDVIGGLDRTTGQDAANAVSPVDTFSCVPFTPTPDREFILVSPEGAAQTNAMGDVFQPDNTLTCSFDTAVDTEAILASGTSYLKVEFVAEPSDSAKGPSLVAFGAVAFDMSPVLIDEEATVTESGDGEAPAPFTVTNSHTYNSTHVGECLQGTEGVEFGFSCTSSITLVDSGEVISATAETARRCYDMAVEKSTAGTATRSRTWTLEKTATPGADGRTTVNFDGGDDPASVQYKLKAMAVAELSDFALSGSVTVHNHHPFEAATVALTDDTFAGAVFSGEGCSPDGTGVVVGAASSHTCAFSIDLGGENPKGRTNVATATQQFGVQYSGSTSFVFEVSDTGREVIVTDQFEGEAEQDLCTLEAPANAATWNGECFIVRVFEPAQCIGGGGEVTRVETPNTGRVLAAGTRAELDSSAWLTIVTTTCQRCGECDLDTAPMYPMALDPEYRSYIVTSRPGEKSVSLCWD